MAKRIVGDGIHEERIIEQLTLFNQFKTTAVLSGRPEPLGVGELFFDETKMNRGYSLCLSIVNRGEWLRNSTKFFVLCFCSLFWP